MKITDVKVFPVDEDKLKAYATITFDNCFIVRDLKVISGNKGYFIAMPSKKRKDGTFRDVAHPLNSETRKMIEDSVLEVYEKENVTDTAPASYHDDDALDTGSYDLEAEGADSGVDGDDAVDTGSDDLEAEGADSGVDSNEMDTENNAEMDTETVTEIDTEAFALEEEAVEYAVDTDEGEFTEAAPVDPSEEKPVVEDTSPVEPEESVEPAESEETEKGAEENPVIEGSDDPEKAFGYEE